MVATSPICSVHCCKYQPNFVIYLLFKSAGIIGIQNADESEQNIEVMDAELAD